jgi:hypothetical protein
MTGSRQVTGESAMGRSFELRAFTARRMQPGSYTTYSLFGGFASTAAGAAVGLIFNGTARIAVWCIVTASSSIAYGLAYYTAPVILCREVLHRWICGIPSA